jgi:hypothetical protein
MVAGAGKTSSCANGACQGMAITAGTTAETTAGVKAGAEGAAGAEAGVLLREEQGPGSMLRGRESAWSGEQIC